jgi:hypothetical protein
MPTQENQERSEIEDWSWFEKKDRQLIPTELKKQRMELVYLDGISELSRIPSKGAENTFITFGRRLS